MNMSGLDLNKYFESSQRKYVYAAAAIIGVGGCFLVYKAYQQQNQQDLEDAETIKTTKDIDYSNDLSMTTLESGANSISKLDTSSFQSSGKTKSFPIQVFVRLRPLVGKELRDKHELLKYELTRRNTNKNKNKSKKEEEVLVLSEVGGVDMKDSKEFKSFRNVLLPIHNNYDTFNTCILPYLKNIIDGGKTCLFAYGHTGSGKTHTVFGYKEHPGMYLLYARALFEYLKNEKNSTNSNESDNKEEEDDDEVMLEVRFTELYDNKLRDLLSPTKEECFVRENKDGDVFIRTNPVKSREDGKVRQFPITGTKVSNENELISVIEEGVKSRNVGLSTLHDKSSRSHAFLEYEIVSKKLMKLRKESMELEAELTQLETTLPPPRKQIRLCNESIKKNRIERNKITNNLNKKCIGGTMVFVDLAGNEYGRDAEALALNNLRERMENLENAGDNDDKKREIEEEMENEKQRLATETKERNQINQSLLALKECIRALHANKKHVGYRNSKLTLYLSQFLKGDRATAIMISNIGVSQKYAKQTINTLRYAQLVAQA